MLFHFSGQDDPEKKSLRRKRVIIFTTGVVLLLLGIFLGDNAVILRKAIFICLECMGIA
jgi:hypothetical protein